MLTIYHVPGTRSLRVVWLCEELGVPYERRAVDFSPEYRASPEWRRLNPVGKVPVMVDGEGALFESGAMVEHLLDKHGEGRLRPATGSRDHALYLQWSWFAESTYARPLGEIVNHRRAFEKAAWSAPAMEEMAGRARLCTQALDDHLADRDYVVTEFTAADVMMGYTVYLVWALEVAQDGEFPNVDAYYRRLSERTAFQRAFNES